MGVNDSTQQTRSIWDYEGINLSDTKEGHGPFTCEMFWFKKILKQEKQPLFLKHQDSNQH